MEYVDLRKLVAFSDNESLSEKYVRCLLKTPGNFEYKHNEIVQIKGLLEKIPETIELCNCLYSYNVPHISKEMDLLLIGNTKCINIELKCRDPGNERVLYQLKSNRHYLMLLEKEIIQYAHIQDTDSLFKYDVATDDIHQSDYDSLCKDLDQIEPIKMVLNDVFSPEKFLISPLNTPEKFIEGNYYLTDHQKQIKNTIVDMIETAECNLYFGITGGAGTGKSLVLYDVARTLSKKHRVLVVHCGMSSGFDKVLNDGIPNMNVIPVSKLKKESIDKYDIIAIDETQRIWVESLSHLLFRLSYHQRCIFSFDKTQTLSQTESKSQSINWIETLCDDAIYALTGRIRANSNTITFINCLMELNKTKELDCFTDFSNITVILEKDKMSAVALSKNIALTGFEEICYTPSTYFDQLDYQCRGWNTHEVIGMEFDSVVMIMDDFFYYDEKNKLKSFDHPNRNYVFTMMLYQGLTRCRKNLIIIITGEQVFNRICESMGRMRLNIIGTSRIERLRGDKQGKVCDTLHVDSSI